MVKARHIPHQNTIRRKCQALGIVDEYIAAREAYKRQGLTPKEAIERVYVEMRIGERHQEWQGRQSQSEIMGKGVPMTPAELKAVKPDYTPASVTQGSEVGDTVLSLPEQIRWVKHQLARRRNGEEDPKSYPSADVLYWYQIAITRPADFDRIVLKLETPEKDADDAWMRDGEYQFKQIETQLREALEEVGDQLVGYEAGFAELLRPIGEAVLSVESEGVENELVVAP